MTPSRLCRRPRQSSGRNISKWIAARWMVACIVVWVLGGCVAPGSDDARVVAATNELTVIVADDQTTFEGLAREFLHDGNFAAELARLNGRAAPRTGDLVVVPRSPINVAGVTSTGYQTVPVLCYHQFTRAAEASHRMEVPIAEFRRQMQYLVDAGYRVVPLEDLKAFLGGSAALPPKTVVLTVDDGYRSFYELARPVLRDLGLPATLFLYTDFIGAPQAVTWQQVGEMQAERLIDLQSHSKSHVSLSRAPQETEADYQARLQEEIGKADSLLDRRLDQRPTHFAYPFGDTSEAAVQTLRRHGYDLGLTVQRGGNASFAAMHLLRRSMVFGDTSLAAFQEMLDVFEPQDLR